MSKSSPFIDLLRRVKERNFFVLPYAGMLRDETRTEAYRLAMSKLNLKDLNVLDVGSGIGVLSFLAEELGAKTVTGLEINLRSYLAAIHLAQVHNYTKIEFLNKTSFDFEPTQHIDFVVSETMGALGVDESYLEICKDLKQRLNISQFIPFKVEVYYQKFVSQMIRQEKENIRKAFSAKITDRLDIGKILPFLEHDLFNFTFIYPHAKFDAVEEPVLISKFMAGENDNGAIDCRISFDPIQCDGVNLFFKAYLDEEIVISNQHQTNKTHWESLLLYTANNADQMHLRHNPTESGQVSLMQYKAPN